MNLPCKCNVHLSKFISQTVKGIVRQRMASLPFALYDEYSHVAQWPGAALLEAHIKNPKPCYLATLYSIWNSKAWLSAPFQPVPQWQAACMWRSVYLWAIKVLAHEKPVCKWVHRQICTYASRWLSLKVRLWQHILSLRGRYHHPQLRTYPQSPPEWSEIDWFCWSSGQLEFFFFFSSFHFQTHDLSPHK